MTRRRHLRVLVVALVLPAVLTGVAACGESPEERRDAYCEKLDDETDTLARVGEEGGPAAFLEALPTLESLAAEAPRDLDDDWEVLIDALHGLEDTLEETGLDPDEVDGEKLPSDLSKAERREVRSAASQLTTPRVLEAAQAIEQQALDVCETQIL